jgi:catechol 2,3-dioxygenase-like lactoylglutathione lyase family enzyme
MITDEIVHASLATADLERARQWYGDKLGLSPDPAIEGLLLFHDGDSMFTVYPSPFAGTARNTVMMRNVPDLRAEVGRLRSRGVVFEEYDMGEFGKTVDGIMSSPEGELAWFKDPDGNVIGLARINDDPLPLPWVPMLAASDIDRARAWYHDKLGFSPAYDNPGAVTYKSGESYFVVYPTSSAGTARNTVAVWRLGDLRSEVARLRSRGVVFEDYDLGELGRTIDGVLEDDEELNAWFKDSEGNILGLAQDKA